MRLIIFLLFSSLIMENVYSQNIYDRKYKLHKKLILEKDLKYDLFRSDSGYLCWSEYYTYTISCLDLKTENLTNLKLKKGKGPTEINSISNISLHKGILYASDPTNFKFIRFDIINNKYLDDVILNKQVMFYSNFSDLYFSTNLNVGFGNYEFPYLNSIDFFNNNVRSLNWSKIKKSPETSTDNFGGLYLMNNKYFIRVGNRINHLVIADYEKEILTEYMYDEPYRKSDPFNPTPDNLTQTLNFYIHDAEIGENNKLYLLAEGRTKTKQFFKNELTVLDLETMKYEDETIKLPMEFKNIVITEKYFIGYNDKDFSLNIYEYE